MAISSLYHHGGTVTPLDIPLMGLLQNLQLQIFCLQQFTLTRTNCINQSEETLSFGCFLGRVSLRGLWHCERKCSNCLCVNCLRFHAMIPSRGKLLLKRYYVNVAKLINISSCKLLKEVLTPLSSLDIPFLLSLNQDLLHVFLVFEWIGNRVEICLLGHPWRVIEQFCCQTMRHFTDAKWMSCSGRHKL